MNVSSVSTKDYENERLSRRRENKPNSKPVLSLSNGPISLPPTTKQTQFKPNTDPIKPNFKTAPAPKVDWMKLFFSVDLRARIVRVNANVGSVCNAVHINQKPDFSNPIQDSCKMNRFPTDGVE
jgi:hypothetical protein